MIFDFADFLVQEQYISKDIISYYINRSNGFIENIVTRWDGGGSHHSGIFDHERSLVSKNNSERYRHSSHHV
jgi:hypothetical protein